MFENLREFREQILANGLLAHVFAIAGFLLALFMVARLMSQKRAPANTFAWLLIIVLLPWVGVPLYLLLGGRKLRKLAERKVHVRPTLPAGTRNPFPPRESPIIHTIESAGGTAPVTGNSMRLITNGEDAYDVLEQQIRSATSTIHVMAFLLGRDDTGRRLIRLLAEKARQGIKVRLLLDSVGSMFTSGRFVDPVREAGGEVARFMPVLPLSSPSSANLRNHRKIAVFDHCTAIVGGHNLAREYLGDTRLVRRWQDFGALIEGPAAALLNDVFIADWCFTTRQSTHALRAEIPPDCVLNTPGTSELQVVPSGPDVPGDPLYEGIVSMIQETKKSIWIVTPYFIPDDVLLRSLIVKARAGKEVVLITPRRSNHPVADFARRHYIREMQRAGAKVLLYGSSMLHSKAMIVDDDIALLGSPNFDLRSLFVNFEIGVLVHSRADIAEMKKWALDLAQRCHPPKPERRRKFQVFNTLAEDLCRLLAPLL
jgi:cardiolipin synthase A/B